ncbi:MAG TPA: GMC family oxidoreductase [Chitinophagaceae bacterium]|nr:GMC family oxidoreductase [Chitinophagaceae bacterium]
MGDPKQVNINNKAVAGNTYDAIVVGSGISGGWAAKELCEKGLKTLLLERGRNVEHIKDYSTANMHPWEFDNRLEVSEKDKLENPVQTKSFAYNDGCKHFFVSDQDHPYTQSKPFNWIRGYQVGGRSLLWGRQTYRLSDLDFEANAKDGHGADWPIRYKDIEQWYSYVETFAGISGQAEVLAHLPDSVFLPPIEMNCLEKQFAKDIKAHYKDRIVTNGRVTNLSRGWNGRGPCQYRNLCSRGCPFGGYFSSNAATIPMAVTTGNLTLRPHAIVAEVLFDEQTNKAKGVRIIDELTKESTEFFAKIIFLNASTIGTATLLLQSTSKHFPDGFGNSSGEVGHNLMDHHSSIGATGDSDSFNDQYYKGRKPTGVYIPRFRNLNDQTRQKDFIRGYAYQADAKRHEWKDTMTMNDSFGASFKEQLAKPGPWFLWLGAFGECLPNHENKVTLDKEKKDKWGLPLADISFSYGENEKAMRKDMHASAVEMLNATGFKNIQPFDYDPAGGTEVHEMGTVRMGKDVKTSVLNGNNQMHDVKNVFITDGSCMPSGGCQNPSLTYMALTARACDFAVSELKKNNL